MAQLDQNHGLLQTIIADIATKTDPLPNPSNEAIASVVLQAQVGYLKSRLEGLDTEVHALRRENASLREENSLLRFENDVLLDNASATQTSQASPPAQSDKTFTTLISLPPDVSPTRKANEDGVYTNPKGGPGAVEHYQSEHQVDQHTSSVASQLGDESPSRTLHRRLDFWCDNIDAKSDEDTSSTTTQHLRKRGSFEDIKEDAAQADGPNTSLVLTCLPPDTTYRRLFQAISVVRPGRIKAAQIRKTAAEVTFFTHEAAEKLHSVLEEGGAQTPGSTLHGVSASWSKRPVPPEDARGRTRVLGVEGRPGFVTADNLTLMMDVQGFGPVVESITAMPPQGYLSHQSPWHGPRQRVLCRFRSVRAAETAGEVLARAFPGDARLGFENLHDPCEWSGSPLSS